MIAEQLVVNRPQSGIENFYQRFTGPLPIENHRIRLHIFVDRSSVEVFANGGVLGMTCQVFPETNSTGVTLFADGGEARLVSLQAYTIGSIWSR